VILQEETIELATPSGPMRTYLYRPVAAGRYPGLVFFSEIFQRTAPIKRVAALLAGHGFVVAVPEISVHFTWHEFNGAHAFIRDEGPRYDPELALTCYRLVIDLFRRKLGEGDLRSTIAAQAASESRH
jgi:dienelactone hydrolase